ncbi:MAG: hypothetical protein ACHQK9_08460 [Reyranellales bacterium]
MVAKPPDAATFVSALLSAVRELTGRRPPPTWTHVDKVQRKLATDNADAVEAAIRFSVAKGWLRSDGDPASSVTLTVEGVKRLEPSTPQ